MAGAKLDFGNGWLGFERCFGDDGNQFLRAVIHVKSVGRTLSAAVELPDVAVFLKEALRQMALAHLATGRSRGRPLIVCATIAEPPMTDLRALLTRAGEALEPFAKLEWGAAAGIGYRTIEDARALHAEITAALADAPDDGWRDIASAPEDSSEIEVKGQGWWSGNGFAVRPTHWRPRP